MKGEWDKELLKAIESVFSDAGLYTATENINGRDVLVIEYDAENAPEDCNISIEQLTENSTVINILISVMSGLNKKQSQDIAALLPYLNKYLTIGSFGLTEQDGYFYFSYSFVIDEQTGIGKLVREVSSALDIATASAEEAVGITAPVINGGKPVSELMTDDISIIQF